MRWTNLSFRRFIARYELLRIDKDHHADINESDKNYNTGRAGILIRQREDNFSGLVKRWSISLSSRRKAHIGTQIQTAVAQSY